MSRYVDMLHKAVCSENIGQLGAAVIGRVVDMYIKIADNHYWRRIATCVHQQLIHVIKERLCYGLRAWSIYDNNNCVKTCQCSKIDSPSKALLSVGSNHIY